MYRGLQEVRNARVIYLDMNSFFASVEQQENPSLRGRPVGVVSHATPSGTILAASYEAKAHGIKTGTKVREARERCPRIVLVRPRGGYYKRVHRQFMAIMHDLIGPEVYARSIDEAAAYMAPNWQRSEFCWELSRQIKARFKAELGECIRCSIGIAPNSLLAKVATDLQKPDGLVEITLENLEETLGRLSLTDLPGISFRNAARLELRGIKTPLELYQQPVSRLLAEFGIWGQQWWWRLHGFEPDGPSEGLKTMGHQHVLKHWLHSHEELRPVLNKMFDRLIHRLRRNGYQCRGVGIFLRMSEYPSFEAHVQLDSPASTYSELNEVLRGLLARLPTRLPAPVRMVSIWFWGLSEQDHGYQLDIFGCREGREQLSRALEKIRDRHGMEALQLGSTLLLHRGQAEEAPGFGRLRDRATSLSGER